MKVKKNNRIRNLDEQFDPPTVLMIRSLQEKISSIGFVGGVGRIYAKELINSLESGLFLASLHLSSSLLEVFVRDLLILGYAKDSNTEKEFNNKLNIVEKYIEDNKKPLWSFSKMADELHKYNVINELELKKLKLFYNTTRTPILHGLSKRFMRFHGEKLISEYLDPKLYRGHSFEEEIENNSLKWIGFAVRFMEKHQIYKSNKK